MLTLTSATSPRRWPVEGLSRRRSLGGLSWAARRGPEGWVRERVLRDTAETWPVVTAFILCIRSLCKNIALGLLLSNLDM